MIRRHWRSDSFPRIYREAAVEDLDWVNDDITGFTAQDEELLKQVARDHQVPTGLVSKLLDLERDMHGMSRRAGIYEKIDQIFREDWPE